MKAILISIKPKWVAKILNGEKTIEIRRTAPKCKLPIDVYIYCMKGDGLVVCDKEAISVNAGLFPYAEGDPEHERLLNGKVVAKFTLDYVKAEFSRGDMENTGMQFHEVIKCIYSDRVGWKHVYLWHISDLEIFDKPRELGEFGVNCAPKNWMYIEN